ncbi:hypothetical protein G6F65_020676 [Rhizopus arrhizus]|nr:hypothetical protein G6F65_020676 [Rhizopus arrhizus]
MLIAPLGSAAPSIMPPAPRSTSTRSSTAIVAVVHGEAADRELVVAEVARGLGHARGLCQCLVQRGEVAVIQLLAGDHADRLRGLADALPQLAQAQLTCRVGAIALAIGGHIHRLQGGLGILAARR